MGRKNKQTIPAQEAAKLMQISPQRLYAYCAGGIFESANKKFGTRWYLEKWEVEKFIQGKIKVEGAYSLEIGEEKKFVAYSRSKNCFAPKFAIPGRRDAPDRLVFCPKGIIFLIEFKRKGEKLRETQKTFHKMMKRLGFPIFTCDTAEEAMGILDRILEPFQK